MSILATNPTNYMGGTWVAWGQGRVPVGIDVYDPAFDTVEETGGEKSHTLTVNEMPSHTHVITSGYGEIYSNFTDGSTSGEYVVGARAVGTHNTPFYAASKGGSIGHNNLQPYITCYMFKRTA